MDTPDTRLPGISVREAAIRLGTSESDIRRRIKRGAVRAESLARPGGTLLRVLLDPLQDAPGAPPSPDTAPSTDAAPTALQDAPGATARLLDKLDERDATIGALYAENGELRERVGRLTAELEAARAELARLEAALVRRRWWWPW